MTKKPKIVKSEVYTASIKVFGKTYESQGNSIIEAISNLSPDGAARGVTVLTLTHGGQSQSRILPKLATVRLFAPSQTMREYGLKQVAARFSI